MIPIKNFSPMGIGPTELPLGYTECEYIESTGTQYIIADLPVKYSRVVCKANSASVVNDNHMFGWRSIDTGCIYHLTYWSSSWSWGNGTANFIDYTAPEVDCLFPHVFDLCASNESEFAIDGEVKATTTLDFSAFQESYKLCFFARMNSSTVYPGKWKIYWAKVIDVRDNTWHTMLPALDPSGTPCMYDTIDRKPYYNTGTGQFLYKIKSQRPLYNLPDSYRECEYLESDGTSWIDTEIVPGAGYGFSITYYIESETGTGPSCKLCGSSIYNNGTWGGVMIQSWDNGSYTFFSSYTKRSLTFGRKATIAFVDGACSWDGTEFTCKKGSDNYSNIHGSVWIMRVNSDATNFSENWGRYYNFKTYHYTDVIQNLIPCLDTNSVPCMFDKLSGKTFYNQGTGTFKYKLK